MTHDPWTDPDPQPGNFDAAVHPLYVEAHVGNPEAKLTIVVGVKDGAQSGCSNSLRATGELPNITDLPRST